MVKCKEEFTFNHDCCWILDFRKCPSLFFTLALEKSPPVMINKESDSDDYICVTRDWVTMLLALECLPHVLINLKVGKSVQQLLKKGYILYIFCEAWDVRLFQPWSMHGWQRPWSRYTCAHPSPVHPINQHWKNRQSRGARSPGQPGLWYLTQKVLTKH